MSPADPIAVPPLAAVLLAAGEGRRLGGPKALLEFPGGTALDLGLSALASAAPAETIVVLGARAEAALPLVRAPGVRAVVNARWADGMVASIQAGLRAISGPYAACLLHLVDVPLVRPELVAELAALWRRTRAPLAQLSDGRRCGHPVIFARALAEEILELGASAGANEVLRRYRDRAVYLKTAEPGPFLDVDTPEDYLRARSLLPPAGA